MSETAEHSHEQPVDYSVEKQLARTVTVTLGWWAHGAVRLVLAVAMLYYGYAKLVLGQFGVADMGDALIAQGEQWAGKLVEQDDGVKRRGRKLSDSGAKARFFHAVSEAHLSKIIKVDLAAQLFSYDIDDTARTLAEMMDGKLLLVTNVEEIGRAS